MLFRAYPLFFYSYFVYLKNLLYLCISIIIGLSLDIKSVTLYLRLSELDTPFFETTILCKVCKRSQI